MIKIIFYFFIFSIIYNIWKNIKINFIKHDSNEIKNKKFNFKNKNDNILDAEFEEIK